MQTLYFLARPFRRELPKLQFQNKKGSWKNSYERCVCESVDDGLGYISKIDEKQNS